jgi:hypothetical protein
LLPSTATAGASLTITSPSTPTSSLPSALGVQPLKMSAVVASSAPTALVFSLASSFPPIPGKLVHKIQSLEFIEMRDLLPDNIALAERLEALPTHRAPFKTPETREVGALSTWVSAFCTYVAVVAAAHPGRVRDMLAYMRLIVREAQKYGGSGWITYDQVFRRNRAGPGARWDNLDPSLHIAYISAQADTPAVPCSICSEVDHIADHCTLASLAPTTKTASPSRAGPLSRDWVRGLNTRPLKHPLTPRSQASGSPKRICISWNRGV